MVVPPLRWTESERGGYLELPLGLVKKSERLTVDQSTKTVREAINCLNCTAWRINGRILEVMETLWDSGGGVAGLPRRSDLPNPPIPDDFETDREVKKAWKAEAVRIRRLNLQTQAERIVFAFKLDVAQRFCSSITRAMIFAGGCSSSRTARRLVIVEGSGSRSISPTAAVSIR